MEGGLPSVPLTSLGYSGLVSTDYWECLGVRLSISGIGSTVLKLVCGASFDIVGLVWPGVACRIDAVI